MNPKDSPPSWWYEPKAGFHCPGCSGCDETERHCNRDGLCEEPFPSCRCPCLKCRAARAGTEQCDDHAAHRSCNRHAEPPDLYDPSDDRFLRRD